MIDMSSLHIDLDYYNVLNTFNSQKNSSDCIHLDWGLFKNIQLKISKNKCPICEYDFSSSIHRPSSNGTIKIIPTIDHFRPKDPNLYPLLKCDDKNYLLMCSECNNSYKGNTFPLHSSTPNRDILSKSISNSIIEKPLIVNPIYDNLLDLFILSFIQNSNGKKLLALKPKENNGYFYEKAKETIKVFGLGNCEVSTHSNQNVHNCRVTILEYNYEKFIEFAQAAKDYFKDTTNNIKQKKLAAILKKNPKLTSFGFYQFILKNQFEIAA